MFVKVKDGAVDRFPYTVWDLRKENPRVSFPHPAPPELLATYGVYPVIKGDDPEYDPKTHRLEAMDTPVYEAEAWVLSKRVVLLTAEELAVQQANAIAQMEAERLNAYRAISDPLFFKWQRGDATKEEWLAAVADIKAKYPNPA